VILHFSNVADHAGDLRNSVFSHVESETATVGDPLASDLPCWAW